MFGYIIILLPLFMYFSFNDIVPYKNLYVVSQDKELLFLIKLKEPNVVRAILPSIKYESHIPEYLEFLNQNVSIKSCNKINKESVVCKVDNKNYTENHDLTFSTSCWSKLYNCTSDNICIKYLDTFIQYDRFTANSSPRYDDTNDTIFNISQKK